MKLIPLTQGKFAQVDDEDYDFLMQWKWFSQFDEWNCYAKRNSKISEGNGAKGILMHRVLMGVTDPNIKVDHEDKNGLNNQKSNLRVCTNAENIRNSFKPSGKDSPFRGVTKVKRKKGNKVYAYWIARISVNMERIYLGTFKTQELAAEAYDEAAKKYHERFATLNFKPNATEKTT